MTTSTFAGKVAIVTGGASGIGAALGKALARAGADVVLADRQADLAESVAAEIRRVGGRATAAELDVRSAASNTKLVEETAARAGAIDYFFANAGIGVGGEMDGYAQRDWDDVIDVNLRGVAYGIQAVYPLMIRRGSGHIVATASLAGLVCSPGLGSYGATKHAVVGLAKSLRIEARRHGVRVSVLCPGVIRTPILAGGRFGRINYPGVSQETILRAMDRLRPFDVDLFARKALRAVARDRAIIVVPGWWKVFWVLERVSPSLSSWVWGAMFASMRKELAAAGATPADDKAARAG